MVETKKWSDLSKNQKFAIILVKSIVFYIKNRVNHVSKYKIRDITG